jgi:hypothetical protein
MDPNRDSPWLDRKIAAFFFHPWRLVPLALETPVMSCIDSLSNPALLPRRQQGVHFRSSKQAQLIVHLF